MQSTDISERGITNTIEKTDLCSILWIGGNVRNGICGIKIANGKIVIKPYPDRSLKSAKAKLNTPQGEVRSQWEYSGKTITFRFSVASNGDCTFI